MNAFRVTFAAVGAGLLLLAACSDDSSSTATSASTTVGDTVDSSAPGSGLGTRPTSGPVAKGAACDLLTADDIIAATGNTEGGAVEDDSMSGSGEQTCIWTLGGTGEAGNGSSGPTITVNLETGVNALPNFEALKTTSDMRVDVVTGVGDEALLTEQVNLFVKVGDKVVELSYMGIAVGVPQKFLTQLAQAAVTRL